MSDAIIVENVHKTFGDVKALDGVSFTATTGKVLGLLGPNGAGKTTIVRVITTLLEPDSGTVSVSGVNVLKNPMMARQVFGLAGQYPAVDETLTGRENLVMVGQLYHLGRKAAIARAQELLQDFTLTDAANRPVKTYSGGMRRRLDLAASIVARPKVLFLDEPTTGLDPRTRMDLWDTIRGLVRGGTTLLLTTQYLEEADQLADRIVVLNKGRAIAEGSAEELKADLASDFIELQTQDPDKTDAAVAALTDVGMDTPQVNAETHKITIPVESGPTALASVVRKLDDNGILIGDIAVRRPSLDDVFLSLTGEETHEDDAPTEQADGKPRRRSA